MNQNIESSPHDATDAAHLELSWLAFRYVSSEMSSEESAEFEARLADDELACVAVAEAVRLNEVVYAALDDSRVTPVLSTVVEAGATESGRSSRSIAVVTSLVVLVILVAVLLPWVASPEDPGVARRDSDQPEDDRVIAESGGELLVDHTVDVETEAASEMLRLWVAPEQPVVALAESFEQRTSLEDADSLVAEIPDWLFAAVQAEAGLLDASAVHIEEN